MKRFAFVQRLLLPLALCLVCSTPATAQTQKFPRKPITFVVPYGPGSGNDVIARILQRKVTENSGYTMIVVNRPGATGTIALETTAAAPPDGHTIIIGSSSQIANQHLSKVRYDFVRDFAAISSRTITSWHRQAHRDTSSIFSTRSSSKQSPTRKRVSG